VCRRTASGVQQALRPPASYPGESDPTGRSSIVSWSGSRFLPSGKARAAGGAQTFSTSRHAARQASQPRVSTPLGSQTVNTPGLHRAIRVSTGLPRMAHRPLVSRMASVNHPTRSGLLRRGRPVPSRLVSESLRRDPIYHDTSGRPHFCSSSSGGGRGEAIRNIYYSDRQLPPGHDPGADSGEAPTAGSVAHCHSTFWLSAAATLGRGAKCIPTRRSHDRDALVDSEGPRPTR
jgi:hypothetical protein